MKKLLLLSAAALAFAANAQSDLIVLDLTKATPALTFNTENGSWTGTYDDDLTSINSQCFSFIHGAMGDYGTWWGFTASNSADNAPRTDYITYQYSNMAQGGIVLNSDGTVKLDEFGAPAVSADVPYMVAYYSPYMAVHPVDMVFNTDNTYEAVGVYVNLTSWPYYMIQDGDAFGRAFNNGDKLTLTIHGISPDNVESTVDVELASYSNGYLTANRGWSYVDLSALGEVNELFFTMKSTDTGLYGDNTPEYFALDKLMVRQAGTGVKNLNTDGSKILSYDRATTMVTVNGADFAVVYDVAGQKVMATDSSRFSLESLPAGVYVVKAGTASIKIAR